MTGCVRWSVGNTGSIPSRAISSFSSVAEWIASRCFSGTGGFVLYYKRLSRGRFQLPRVTAGADRVVLDGTQLAMLLGGFDPVRTRRTEAWGPPAPGGVGVKNKAISIGCTSGIDTAPGI